MIEEECASRGLRLTSQRRAVLQVLGDANDHPSLESIHDRAKAIDRTVSVATVYRLLQYLCRHKLALKHNFGPLSTRYELNRWDHHHLIDVDTGRILEFASETMEKLVRLVADDYGYDYVEHRAELFCRARAASPQSGRC
jgi:Fur family ferric uptake transcriptional regulator